MEKRSQQTIDYQRLQLALRAAQVCVFEVDIPAQRYTFFENAEAVYQKSGADILADLDPFSQLSPEEYQARLSDYFSHPDDLPAISQAFASIYSGRPASYTARMKAGDTNYVWCKIDVSPVMEGNVPVRMIGAVSNLDRLMQITQQYRSLAELDALTGLCNRQGFQRHLSDILAQPDRAPRTLLLADLDNMKRINDQQGHLAGDQALLQLSRTLRRLFPEAEVIARWGGDEFFVLLPHIAEEPQLTAQLAPLLAALEPGAISCSFGAAILPPGAQSIDEAFHQADRALYQAKGRKPALAFYRPEAE